MNVHKCVGVAHMSSQMNKKNVHRTFETEKKVESSRERCEVTSCMNMRMCVP